LTGIALVILLTFGLSYQYIDWARLFNVSSQVAKDEARPAICVLVLCFAIAIPTNIVNRVQMALQRGFMASLWQCFASILALVCVLLAVHFRAPLPILVLCLVGTPIVAGALNSVLYFRLAAPDISPVPRFVSRIAIQTITKTGLLFFVIQIVATLLYASTAS